MKKTMTRFRLTVSLWVGLGVLFFMLAHGAVTWAASGTLAGNETWSGTVDVTGSVTVPAGITLRIEAGTIVKFADSTGLTVNGKLDLGSTEQSPVIFTSASASPARGKWNGIVVNSSSTTSAMQYVIVEYATSGVTCNSASPTLRNSIFRNNSTQGISLNSSASEISNNQITGNGSYGVSLSSSTSVISGNFFSGNGTYAVNLDSSNATIKNNYFVQNGGGIYGFRSNPVIRNNIIRDHSGNALYFNSYNYSTSNPTIEFNTIVSNGYGIRLNLTSYATGTATIKSNIIVENSYGIYCDSGNYTLAYNDVWGNSYNYKNLTAATTDISVDPQFTDFMGEDFTLKPGSPCLTAELNGTQIGAYGNGGTPQSYIIQLSTTPTTAGTLSQNEQWSGTIVITADVTVPQGIMVKIEPGTVVRFAANTGLIVNGKLEAAGTADSKITFTTASSTPAKGQWKGITFNDTSIDTGVIDYVVIEYATTGITCTSASPDIKNSSIRYNNTGISLSSSVSEISNNQITGNGSYGVSLSSSTSVISGNFFSGNGSYGVNLDSSNATIKNNYFAQNGGGIYGFRSNPVIRNNIIRDHSGNALYFDSYYYSTSNPTIEFNTIVSNGYGIRLNLTSYASGTATIKSNIIVENSYGIYCDSGNYTLEYNNVWGNTSSNYSGLTTGSGDISQNPLFIGNGDYHLQPLSPCINTGDPFYINEDGSRADMGAYGALGGYNGDPSNNRPGKPVNAAPADGSLDQLPTPVLSASAFTDPDAGDFQIAAQWQVRANSGTYASPVFDSGIDQQKFTSITVPWGKLQNGGSYAWHVRYRDNKSGWSEYSQETTFTVVADTTLPDTSITSGPAEGATTSASVSFAWSGSDNLNGPLTWAYRIDQGAWSAFSTATSTTLSGLTQGAHAFSVQSRDYAGNVDPSPAVRNFVVDSTPPAISDVSVQWTKSSITVRWTTSEPATSRVDYGTTTGYGWSSPLDNTLVTSHIITVSNLAADTLYHVRLRSKDAVGNEAVSGDNTVTTLQDSVPPDTTITQGPAQNALVTSAQVTFGWTGSDDVTAAGDLTYAWRLDTGAWSPFAAATSQTLASLAEGAHTFEVKARDKSGNEDQTPAGRSFTVDSLAPAPPTVAPVTSPTKASTVTLSGTKEAGSYLYINGSKQSTALADTTWSATVNLSEGSNSFAIVARDEGNNQSQPITVAVVRDTAAPSIASSVPATNTVLTNPASIKVTFSDVSTGVDLAASLADATVKNAAGTAIVGIWSVSGSDILFVPTQLPMAEGTYIVTVYPVDLSGNKGAATFSFTVDRGPPTVTSLAMSPTSPHKAEAVTFTLTFSEAMDTTVQPTVTFTRSATYTLTGSWLDSSTWRGNYTFTTTTGDGNYTVTVKDARDKALNVMASQNVGNFVLNTTSSALPTIGPVTTPTKTVTQTLSGTKPANTAILINGALRVPVSAATSWSYAYSLAEGKNILTIVARDEAGNDSSAITPAPEIVLDTTPPLFTIDTVQNPATTATQKIGGKKEPGCIVKLNGTTIFDATNISDSWAWDITLTEGIPNHFAFTAADALGNVASKAIDIVFDLSAPSSLATGALIADGVGKGDEVNLSWPSYQEPADLGYYRVYAATADFSSVAGMTPKTTVTKGTRTAKVTGLTIGTVYFLAVVPVDQSGNSAPVIYTVQATPRDTMPPEDVTGLAATSGYSSVDGNTVTLNWTAGKNSMGDLADQLIYLDSGTGYGAGTSLGKTATTFTRKALADATLYKFKLTVKDSTGHESTGTIIQAVTRLANPIGLTAASGNQKITLSWQPVASPYFKTYNIYRLASGTSQTNISAMTLVKSQTGTTLTDVNLINGTTYQYAVTVVNSSGAERSDVQSAAATPRQDAIGPVIANVSLTPNQVVTAPVTITATAQDAESTMGRMQLYIDSILAATQNGGSISHAWNVLVSTDGPHTLKFTATDSLGNLTEMTVPVIVSLAQPAVPAITTTFGGPITSTSVAINGTAQPGSTVSLRINGAVAGQPAIAALNGAFSFAGVKLVEGDNLLAVKAANRGGESSFSNDLRVIVDIGAPPAPVSLGVKPLAGGSIQFNWQAGTGEIPTGYNLYDSTATFSSATDAGVRRINIAPLLLTQREQIPADDTPRFYAVTALDGAGNESPLSNVVTIATDRIAPSLPEVRFTLDSGQSPTDNTYGPGSLKVGFTVSEPLKEPPFFSLEPVAGSPVVVPAGQIDPTHYQATLTVDANWPHGATTWKFSGKDMVGNRGNASGAGPVIDVKGPAADITAPVTLLKSTSGPMAVAFTLDEPSVTLPGLVLNGQNSTTTTVTALTSADGGKTWTGTLNPAGLAESKAQFVLTGASDRFGNGNASIHTGASLLVYSIAPPAPAVPELLTAKPGKGGAIALTWLNVSGAQKYNIYRRGDGETTPTVAAVMQSPATSHTDTPPADGAWRYSVSALGLLDSESVRSAELSADSDRTPPVPPTGLALSFSGNGVKADWQPPLQSAEQPALYRLYRSDAPITDLSGLTAVAEVKAMPAIDPSPVKLLHHYALTAVDAVGNESSASASAEITFAVIPVRNLLLSRVDDGKPTLSWEAGEAGLQGFHIYRNNQRVTQTPTSSTTYSDGYYPGGAVSYGISAVSSNGTESPVREVSLPQFAIGLKDGATMRRGLLEDVPVVVSLPSEATTPLTIDAISLKIGELPESSLNGPFTVTPGTPLEIRKVAATENTAPPQVAVVVTALLHPVAGTTVRITRNSLATVLGAGTALEIFNEPLSRGGTAKVRLKVNNLGSARAEFLTSENNGPTSQVKVNLWDEDGNLIAQGSLSQQTGAVVNLGAYATARIEPGGSFLSDPITFVIPASAPYKVFLEAVIDTTYYHYHQDDQVVGPGLRQGLETSIADVSYSATAATDKQVHLQGESVIISGTANSTATNGLVASVPVKIGISVKGFDRFFTVTTGQDGTFSYTFTPGATEVGSYSVWASHPDITARSMQARFAILGLSITPERANLKLVKGKSFDLPVTLENTGGTTLSGLAFTTTASSGVTATVITTGSVSLAAGEKRNISLRILVAPDAPASGFAYLEARSTEGVTARVNADITAVAALPVITTSPSYIDTGLVRGTQRNENFTIANRGYETLRNVRLEGPSLSWLSLSVERTLGDIPAGQELSIGLDIKPGESVPQGIYDDRIVIYADNHAPYTYHLQVTVTSAATGNVQFDVLNELMKDVGGATINLQHQSVLELYYTLKTVADGTATLFDIPEGRYSFNISAPGHKELSGSFAINPGLTTTVPIALEVTLVQVEWSVTPVVLEDRYEVKLTQTFETNVPTPVLVTEPPSLSLPELAPGQVFNGEFKVTNYGLVEVTDVKIDFPKVSGEYDIEVLGTIPAKLGPFQKFSVAYRVTRRQASQQIAALSSVVDEVNGFGGSPCHGSFPINIFSTAIICPGALNERTVLKVTTHYVSYTIPGTDCSGLNITNYPSWFHDVVTPGCQNTPCNNLPTAPPAVVTPVNNNEEGCIYPNKPDSPPTCDTSVGTGSFVDLLNGPYSFSETDLRVAARGIPIELTRTYRSNLIMKEQGTWKFAEPMNGPFGYGWYSAWFAKAGDGIFLDGEGNFYEFAKDSGGGYQPHYQAGLSFRKLLKGYEVKKLGGETYTFTDTGKLSSVEDRNGNVLTLSYDNSRLSSITDAVGRQVLSFSYDGNGHVIAATDLAGRVFTYEYNDKGNLVRVKFGGIVMSSYEYANPPVLLSSDYMPTTSCHYGTFTGPIMENGKTYIGTISGYICDSPYKPIIMPFDPDITQFDPDHAKQTTGSHFMVKRINAVGESYQLEYQAGRENLGIVKSVTNPDGNKTQFTSGFTSGEFVYTDYNGRRFKRLFNINGKLVQESELDVPNATDSERIIRKVEYLAGRIEKITDGAGNVTTIQRNEADQVIRSTNGEGETTTYAYTPDGKPLKIIDPLGVVTSYEYDTKGNLVKEIRAEGKQEEVVTSYAYNANGELVSKTLSGATTTLEYNTAGQPKTITDPLVNKTSFEYDQVGNLTAVVDAAGNRTEMTYDSRGNRLTRKDPLGNVTTYTYNAANRLTSVKDPFGRTTSYDLDIHGKVRAIIDPLGNRRDLTYDGNGNLVKIVAGDATTSMAYDGDDRQISMTDPLGNVTRYEYPDGAGCTKCGGSVGIPKKLIDPLNNATENTFDKAGRIKATTDPLGNLTTTLREKAGRVSSMVDANGNTTGYTYDALGRVSKMTDANGGETVLAYDALGNLVSLNDPNGNTTTFTYDQAGRKTRETRPMGQTTEYTYYPNGLLKTVKDAKGQVTTHSYDAAGRLVEITYADGKKDIFGYDAVGNMTSYGNESVNSTLTYDELNRKTSETVNYGDFSKTYRYTYDSRGNKASFTSPEGKVYSYTYNKKDQVTVIAFDTMGITFDYQWNSLTRMSLPNGVVNDFQHNANAWLSSIIAKQGATTLASSLYGFDKVGNITGKTTEQGGFSYLYDPTYQLTQATSPTLPQETFTYDKTGNRLSSAATTSPWSYNRNNELGGYDDVSFAYDANGNTIRKTAGSQVTNYHYNSRDRLESAQLPDGRTALYTYDPFGRRIRKQVGAEITYFVYANEGLIGEYDLTGNLKKGYGWKPGGLWGTNPVFMIESGQYYFYQNDHLGTQQKMTDGNGNVVWSATYTAFGEANVDLGSTVTNNLRFPGQYFDKDTETNYNWHRYYDMKVGRYTQTDPIRIKLPSMNLYIYVSNDPFDKYDPTGLVEKNVVAPVATAAEYLKAYEEYLDAYKAMKSNFETWKEGGYGSCPMGLPDNISPAGPYFYKQMIEEGSIPEDTPCFWCPDIVLQDPIILPPLNPGAVKGFLGAS